MIIESTIDRTLDLPNIHNTYHFDEYIQISILIILL